MNFKSIRKALAFAGVVSLALLAVSCSKDTGKKVVIKGSTTVLPIAQKAAEEFRKKNNISISIEGSGSGNGIKALIDGSCDIANSSREMKDKEVTLARKKGIGVKETVVAYDMIVPVVHSSNPVSRITQVQLKAIYDGSITNWKQLGGKDEKIVVISRDTSSGTYEVWHKKVMKKADVRKDALLQASNGAVVSAVSGNPRAIGYIGFGYLDESVKGLIVDRVQPTLENGKSGKYPISRKLYMYSNEKKLSPEAKSYLDYVTGKEGQTIVKEAGFISL